MSLKSDTQRRFFYAPARRENPAPIRIGGDFTISHAPYFGKEGGSWLLRHDAHLISAHSTPEKAKMAANKLMTDPKKMKKALIYANPEADPDITEGMARAFFARAWADGMSDRGYSFSGIDIMEALPSATPVEAYMAADRLVTALVDIDALYAKAAKADDYDGHEEDAEYAEEFGHYIAMQAMGVGVSWFDDHESFPINIPYIEFTSHDLPTDVFPT